MEIKICYPTFLNPGKQGEVWKIQDEADGFRYFIQVNDVTKDPHWVPVSMFLETALENHLNDDEFIAQCLKLYEHNTVRPFSIINRIIR